MPYLNLTIEQYVDVYCERCGAGLCNQTDAIDKDGKIAFYVTPCGRCLEDAREEGREEVENG